MRLSTLILLLSAVSLVCGCGSSGTTPPTPPDESEVRLASLDTLRAVANQDLSDWKEEQLAGLRAAVATLVPGPTYRNVFDYRPERVWEVRQADGTPLVVLLEKIPYIPHPGSTPIRLTAFDPTGQMVAETEFTTGHRCYLNDSTVEQRDGSSLFVLKTGPGPGPGPNVGRQVCALVGGRFDLVRLENLNGGITRNGYYVSHFTCGPTTAGRAAADWEADLFSADRLKVLRALVWLGGYHWDLQPGDKPERQHEDFAEVRLVREVRANKAVAARIAELVKSDDTWVREAAQLAMAPKDARF